MNCKKCGYAFENAGICPLCGTDNRSEMPTYSMKWYKFLIYFMLFASAAINVIGAILYFTGGYYEGEADLVYTVFPELKGYDFMMGIASLGIAALAIVARVFLAGYKRNSKILICALYALNAVLPFVYTLLANSATKMNLFNTNTVGTMLGSVVMVLLNYIYFNKRNSLFIY